MIKALLPMSQWGSTVIMSDLLNNDHVNALSGRSDWRVLQRHGPACHWLRPTFLRPKIPHNVCHLATTKCCCSRVISCWKKYNYVPVARQTLYWFCGLCRCYARMWVCLRVCMAKREWERFEIVVMWWFFKNSERSMRCSCCRWRGLKRGAFVVLTMEGHKPFFIKDKSTHFDWPGVQLRVLMKSPSKVDLQHCFWRIIFHCSFQYK